MAVGVNADSFQKDFKAGYVTSGPLISLLASSVVTLVSILTSGRIHKSEDHFAPLIFGLVLSLVTIIIMSGVLELEVLQRLIANHIVLGAISIMWVISASFLTFRGPFLDIGNGYFGAWGAALSSVYAFNAARRCYHCSTER